MMPQQIGSAPRQAHHGHSSCMQASILSHEHVQSLSSLLFQRRMSSEGNEFSRCTLPRVSSLEASFSTAEGVLLPHSIRLACSSDAGASLLRRLSGSACHLQLALQHGSLWGRRCSLGLTGSSTSTQQWRWS